MLSCVHLQTVSLQQLRHLKTVTWKLKRWLLLTIREEDMPYDFETLKETKHIRRSVYDLQPITLDEEYPGDLPEDLKPFHYCFAREGHILMIIPRNYLQEAFDENDLIGWNPDDFAVGCYFKPFHIIFLLLFAGKGTSFLLNSQTQ